MGTNLKVSRIEFISKKNGEKKREKLFNQIMLSLEYLTAKRESYNKGQQKRVTEANKRIQKNKATIKLKK